MRFGSGFAAGVATVMVALQAAMAAFVLPGLRAMYREFRGDVLPPSTQLALGPAWAWGSAGAVAIAVVAASTLLAERERPRLAALIAIAVAAIGLLGFTYWAAHLPLTLLAGNIAAD